MVNFEVGRVYVGQIIDMKSYNTRMIDIGPQWLHPYYHFVENVPFLVLEEEHEMHNVNAKYYKILINETILYLNYYDEPYTKFDLIC